MANKNNASINRKEEWAVEGDLNERKKKRKKDVQVFTVIRSIGRKLEVNDCSFQIC